MVLANNLALVRDNGLRNYLRRVPPDSVLYLPGLEGGGAVTKDYSGYANDGTIIGATWVRLPSGLWTLNFDGLDDNVNCGNASSFDFSTGGFSIEFWADLTSMGADDFFCIKIQDGDNRWYCQKGQDLLRFYGRDTAGSWNVIYGTTNITALSGWHHCVLVVTKTTNSGWYLDGVFETARTATSGSYDNTGDFKLGYTSSSMTGGLALIRVYNVALASTIPKAHYSEELHLFGG